MMKMTDPVSSVHSAISLLRTVLVIFRGKGFLQQKATARHILLMSRHFIPQNVLHILFLSL